MLSKSLLALATILPVLGSWIPSVGDVFQEATELVYGAEDSISTQWVFVDGKKRQECTLTALGEGKDDTENFLKIIKKCGKGGIINFPDPV